MKPRLRRLALTAHVVPSVGWLGAVAAYLALAIAGLASDDATLARGAYRSMALIGGFVIVPCSLAALLTGLIQAAGTEWGLLRHTWVVAKLALSTIGTAVLLGHMRAVRRMSTIAADGASSLADFGALRAQLVVHGGRPPAPDRGHRALGVQAVGPAQELSAPNEKSAASAAATTSSQSTTVMARAPRGRVSAPSGMGASGWP